jgi:SAM-dependent methyltransferase
MHPDHVSFIRYLEAKKTIDDRSLNAHVAHRLRQTIKDLFCEMEINVFEAGCGIGTMIERMLSWGVFSKATYTAIDIEPEYVEEAMGRLRDYGLTEEEQAPKDSHGALRLKNYAEEIRVILKIGDASAYALHHDTAHRYHLILAHAFLDLVDIYSFLPSILSLGIPGGLAYFTLNFDGVTSIEPIVEADLDRHIIALYHETMDRRIIQGRPSGDSQTGRHLLPYLQRIGLNILDAGSSDWVVFPDNGSYPNNDAYFLHFIIDTVYRALQFSPEINPGQLHSWIDTRHQQIDRGELFFAAHQIDVLCRIPCTTDRGP